MPIEEIDTTGKMPTVKDVEEAEQAVKSLITKIATVPPEIAVQLPNILRCLQVAKATLRYHEGPETR